MPHARSSAVGKGVGMSSKSGRTKTDRRKNSIGHTIFVTSTRYDLINNVLISSKH